MSGRVPALRGIITTFPATASVTGMALRYAPIRGMPNRRRPAQSANSNGIAAAAYFGVDPHLDMIYILLVQTQNERARITPAFKKLVYDAFAADK